MAKLIKETTKSERENYLNKLFACKNGDCENCGVCKIFAGTSPQEVYYDYIIGKREFLEISQTFNTITTLFPCSKQLDTAQYSFI